MFQLQTKARVLIITTFFLCVSILTDWSISSVDGQDQDAEFREGADYIAYSVYDGNSNEIYLVDVDSLERIQLTDSNDMNSGSPRWSPDGTQISYVTYEQDARYPFGPLSVMDADGANQHVLVADLTVMCHDWSSDGQSIAFQTDLPPANSAFLVNVENGELFNLYDRIEQYVELEFTSFIPAGDCPVWSLESRQIFVIISSPRGTFSYILSVGGPGLMEVDFFPRAWHPDGLLLFEGVDLYTTDENGLNTRMLTNDGAEIQERDATWSPDGKWVAYTASIDDNRDIYVLNVDKATSTRLTTHQAFDGQFTWSPDSQRIAFISDRDGNQELYVIDIDSLKLRRITDTPFDEWGPSWRFGTTSMEDW